jgi:hypothetical protein
VYFEQVGQDNTEKCLQIAVDEAQKRGIRHLVVASTVGSTGLQAAQMTIDSDIQVIAVAHSSGHAGDSDNPGKQLMPDDTRKEIEDLGGIVFIGTDVLTGFPIGIRARGGYSEQSLIADALRMFGQGMKVCVEIVAMATDANLIPVDDVISVAGTGRGADTAAVIGANSTNRFFDIKVREILAKPKNF